MTELVLLPLAWVLAGLLISSRMAPPKAERPYIADRDAGSPPHG